MAQILCYNCASPLDQGVRFCMECGAAVKGTAPPPWDQTQVYGAGQPLSSPESSPLQSPSTETFAALPAEPFYPSLPDGEMAVPPPAEPPHPQGPSPDA